MRTARSGVRTVTLQSTARNRHVHHHPPIVLIIVAPALESGGGNEAAWEQSS